MDQLFPLPAPEEPKKLRFLSKAWFRKLFMHDQLAGINGFLFLTAAAVFFALIIGIMGILPGVLLFAIFVGLPMIYGLVVHPRFGVTFFLIAAYLIMWVIRLGVIPFPLGTVMDGMELLFVIGFFIKQKTRNEWELFNNPISIIIIVWIIYNLLEVINPSAESRLAWVYTIRSVAVVMLMFYIFLYNIRTKEFIRFIIKLWLVLATFGALYGLKQQYIGFYQFEEDYLNSDPNIANLLFIGGQWRKFSIFSDPVAFSYNMVVSSMLCIGMITGPLANWKKIVLGALAGLYLFAMLHSGTRGAFVLPPVALILLSILKFNRQVMMAAIIGGIGMLILIFIPTSNPTIYRFQTAFRPSEDASFNVRKINQKRIQPFILTHPMGGGLGATGTWGQRFAPNSFLANFPPDSGYVRVAVEMGWIGLLLICVLMFIILRTGIINYYAIRDPELKSYCLAMVLIIFCYHIGNYPQEAIVQFPSNVYFYLVAALIVITKRIDDHQNAGMPHPKFMIINRDIIVVGQQPWDVEIGSNCKNIAIEFAKHNRVLYVNSPLDRITKWRGSKDDKIKKRIRVIKGEENGLVPISNNLWNLYPNRMIESINWIGSQTIFEWLNKINNQRFARAIQEAVDELGFTNVILFNDNDMFRCFYLPDFLRPATSIYYSRDYMLAVDYWKKHGVKLEPELIAKNDLCVANSTYLADYCRKYNAHSYYVGQGCELDLFLNYENNAAPDDIKHIHQPIIGYVGALLGLRLDIGLLEDIALQKPNWQIVLVGPEDDAFKASKLHLYQNVHFLGPKSPDVLPAYINAFDVCLNPQVISDVTIGNYPRKIDEYLAMGKPVVATSTPFMEAVFSEHTYLGKTADAYIQLIEKALAENDTAKAITRKEFAGSHTWENSVGEIYKAIEQTYSSAGT